MSWAGRKTLRGARGRGPGLYSHGRRLADVACKDYARWYLSRTVSKHAQSSEQSNDIDEALDKAKDDLAEFMESAKQALFKHEQAPRETCACSHTFHKESSKGNGLSTHQRSCKPHQEKVVQVRKLAASAFTPGQSPCWVVPTRAHDSQVGLVLMASKGLATTVRYCGRLQLAPRSSGPRRRHRNLRPSKPSPPQRPPAAP